MSCYDDSWEFYRGESKTMEIDLVEEDDQGCETVFVLPTNVNRKITVEIPAEDTNITLDLTSTPPVQVVDEKLKPQLKIDLTPNQTNQMVNGSVVVTIDEAGDGVTVTKAVAMGVVRKKTLPNC